MTSMKIWVTGGSDHWLAAWLIDHLEECGHELYRSSWDATDTDRSSWVEVLRSSHADLIVHADELAAPVTARRHPMQAVRQNAGGPALLAQACAEAVVPLVLLSASDAAAGQTMYGLSKLWGEQAAQLFAGRTGVQIVRLHNVYGPDLRHGPDVSLPLRMLRCAADGDVIAASPDVSDSFLYVGDAVRAVAAIIADARPGIWNVASRDAVAETELAAEVLGVVGRGGVRTIPAAAQLPRPGWGSLPDTTALLSLGWQQQTDLPGGLRLTAEQLGIRTTAPSL